MTDRDSPETPVDALFARLELAAESLLMLDYDGTLAPFRADPAQAFPYPGVIEILDAIMAHGSTRMAVISGRPARELTPLLGTRAQPELWGSHGWERIFADGRYQLDPIPADAQAALQSASVQAEQTRAWGARLERKPSALALHWRGLREDEAHRIRAWAQSEWKALCATAPLSVLDFEAGIELRVHGRTKAHAVATLLQECNPDIPAAYLGDDVTDEDAFVALAGRGLGVLVRPQKRETAAQAWLQPPEELLAFLQRWERVHGRTQ